MKEYPKAFWLVLLFTLCFTYDAFRVGDYLIGMLMVCALIYMIPGYIRYLLKKPD